MAHLNLGINLTAFSLRKLIGLEVVVVVIILFSVVAVIVVAAAAEATDAGGDKTTFVGAASFLMAAVRFGRIDLRSQVSKSL